MVVIIHVIRQNTLSPTTGGVDSPFRVAREIRDASRPYAQKRGGIAGRQGVGGGPATAWVPSMASGYPLNTQGPKTFREVLLDE